MRDISACLGRDNKRRLIAARVLLQEILHLKEKPDEEIILALALILCNVTLDFKSKGLENIIYLGRKSKRGVRLNLTKFFKVNYEDLRKHESKRKKNKTLH